MTVKPSMHGAVAYKLETAWCEDLDTLDTRLQVLGAVDVSGLTREMVRTDPAIQRQDEDDFPRRSVFGGSFSFELELGGHGATGVGAIAATDLSTLLGYCVGNSEHAAVGAGMQGAGTNTKTHLDTATAEFAVGMLLRTGVKGDTRADGSWSHVTGFTDNGADEDVELGVEAPVASNQTDEAAGAAHVYPSHDGEVDSLRFLLQTANRQYFCRGCFNTAIEFLSINPGEHPRVRLTFGVSQWELADETFPTALNTDAKVGAPVTAAGLHLQARGTATLAIQAMREFNLTINHEVQPVRGADGVFEFQDIVGAVRISCHATIEIVLDADDSDDSPTHDTWYNTLEADIVAKEILYGMSTGDERALAFFFPNVKPFEGFPVQEEIDGLNRVRLKYKACTNVVTTNDLTLSNWRLAMG